MVEELLFLFFSFLFFSGFWFVDSVSFVGFVGKCWMDGERENELDGCAGFGRLVGLMEIDRASG